MPKQIIVELHAFNRVIVDDEVMKNKILYKISLNNLIDTIWNSIKDLKRKDLDDIVTVEIKDWEL